MRISTFILAFIFWSFSFSQENYDSKYEVHYILDATSSSIFFDEIYNSIDSVERVFLSSCFYYIELFKAEKVSVDTFDLLSPKNYTLLNTILSKRKDLYGFTKSSYFIPYFNLYTDTVSLNAMNNILDSVKFKSKYSKYRSSSKIKRLLSLIEKDDSLLIKSFLDYLPDSIIQNRILYDLHRSMLLDTSYICNPIFNEIHPNSSNLVIDFSFYKNIIYGQPNIHLWCSDYSKGNVCYHINLTKCNGIKNHKLRKSVRKYFNLKRKNIRRGGNYKMPNGNEVRIYNSNTN